MILKLIIIGGGLYMLFRMFIAKPQIPGTGADQHINAQPDQDEGEYVDYEEVD